MLKYKKNNGDDKRNRCGSRKKPRKANVYLIGPHMGISSYKTLSLEGGREVEKLMRSEKVPGDLCRCIGTSRIQVTVLPIPG